MQPTSLADAVDLVNEATFWGRPLPAEERDAIARWLAALQGTPGAYMVALFAPTAADVAGDVRTFTGERLQSDVGRRHILGEEAARALWLLNSPLPDAMAARERATQAMAALLSRDESRLRAERRFTGVYCCGACGVSVWRHITAGGLANVAHWLQAGLATLRATRSGDGGWGRFPFWYTVSALAEMDAPQALDELRYATSRLKRATHRVSEDRFAQRRRALAERSLARL